MQKEKKLSVGDFQDFGFFPISYLKPTVTVGCESGKMEILSFWPKINPFEWF